MSYSTESDKARIREYAKTHTAKEIMYEFRFPSVGAAYIFLRRNGIRCLAVKDCGKPKKRAVFLDWLVENSNCALCRELKWDCNCENAPHCKEYLGRRFSEIIG